MKHSQAVRLAARIRDYWAARGCTVSAGIEKVSIPTDKGRSPLFAITSDLVNGLPRDATKETVINLVREIDRERM